MVNERLESLLGEIKDLEKLVQQEMTRTKVQVSFSVADGKVSFAKEVVRMHHLFRENIVRYVLGSNFLFILTSPVIYFLIFPAVVMDVCCCCYQQICFPIYRIPKVNRHKYIRFDRHKLAYLNGIQKFNCEFCAYFNGTLAFAREIASRTEQYWCPIRHALAVKGSHNRYLNFLEYGDAESYSRKLTELRHDLQKIEK